MTPAVFVLSLLLTQQPSKELKVELLGPPRVKHLLLLSQTRYFGNDRQLTQEVRVLGEDDKPVPGQIVTFSARTKDGVVPRIRATGVTDNSGRATVIGFLDVASADLRLSLQACVKDSDYCSAPVTTDLRQRSDAEIAFSYNYHATAGDQPYRLNGVSNTAIVVNTESALRIQPRFSYSLLERGRGMSRLAASTYVGSDLTIIKSTYGLSPSETSLRFRGMTSGFSVEMSRFQLGGSIDFPTQTYGGSQNVSIGSYQPISDQFVAVGEAFYSRPRPPSGEKGSFGSTRGSFGGIAYSTNSGMQRLQAEFGWVWSDSTTFYPSAGTVQLPKSSGAAIRVRNDIDRGGPLHFRVFGVASGFGSGVGTFDIGVDVTLRKFIPGLR